MKKGIIFDVDGTLWDATQAVADSWNDYLERAEKDITLRFTAADIRGVMGMTMSEISEKLFHMVDAQRRIGVTQGCFDYEVEYLKTEKGIFYPDLRETFEKLSESYHLYIVSNCQSGYIEDFVFHAKMKDLVEDTECFGDTGKPKADNIRLVVERNHLDLAVYVGDTAGDYQSTCLAGLPFIHAAYGFGTLDVDVPAIRGLKELPEIADKLLS